MLLKIISALYHRLPIRSGLTPLAFNPVINRLMSGQPDIMMSSLRDGTPIEVDVKDHDGRILYLFGSNDIKVSLTANALLNPGDVFLDIGANYASIGLAAAAKVGPAGKVHLFEPQSALADRVNNAIIAGRHDNVVLHRLGLMDADGVFTIKRPATHSGRASFVAAEHDDRFSIAEQCTVREIESFVTPLISDAVFGAKLDVEGAEPAILPWLVQQPNIRFVIFEAARNADLLYRTVVASDMTLFGLNRHPLRLRLTRIDTLAEIGRFHDVLAVALRPQISAPKLTSPAALTRLVSR